MQNCEEKKNVPYFDEIGGYEFQKAEAKKISDFFRNYSRFYSHGARLPKGVIFYGVPGTGKTMFARAIANEAGVPLFELTTDAFYRESSISTAIQGVFAEAKKKAPSMILIDELDRMVNCESSYQKNESDRQREALRVLLTEIDNAEDQGVLVVATANADIRKIPAALVRNGRIEKHIEIGIPDKDDRKAILDIYLSRNEMFKNISSMDIASYTMDFTGASLKSLVNDVLISCITKDKEAAFNDFLEPIHVIRSCGIKKKPKKDNADVIYHEIGHFIAEYHLKGSIGMINVVPYGNTQGIYSRLDRKGPDESDAKTGKDVWNDCIISVSGLTATELFLKEPYLGASSDMSRITGNYIKMLENGIGDSKAIAYQLLARTDYDSPYNDYSYQASMFAEFLEKIRTESKEILSKHEALVHALYDELVLHQVLTHMEIEEIVKKTEK